SLVLSSSDDEDHKTNKITSKKAVEAVGGKYSHSFSINKAKDGTSNLKYHAEMDKHDSTSNGTSISKLRLSDELASQNSTSHSDSSMQKESARSLNTKRESSCVENVNRLISRPTSNNSNTNSITLHVNKLVLESDSCDESPPSVNSEKDSSKSKLIERLHLNFSSDSQSDANEEKPLSNFNSERKLRFDSLRDSLPDVDVNSGSNLCPDPSGHSSPELDTRKKPANSNSGLNIRLDSSSNSSQYLDVRKKIGKLKSDQNTCLDSSNNSLPNVNVIEEPAEFKSGPNLCLDSSYDSLPDVDIRKKSLAKSQNQFPSKPISQNVQNKNFGKFSKKIVSISSSESSGEDSFRNYINSARKKTQDLRKKKQSAKSPVADENFIVPDSDEEYFSTSSATPPQKPKRIPQNTEETTSTPALSRNMKWRNTPRIILDSSSDDEDYLLKKKRNKKVKPKTPKLKETTNSSSKCLSGPLSFLGSLTMDIPLNKVHPDALPFVKNFKKDKESLTEKLYQYFNSHVFTNHLPSSMNIKWNPRLTKTAGYCYYQIDKSKPSGRGARIELSTKVIDAPGRLRDTLIHELCHAASWIISGYKDGHGPLWKSWASKAMCMFPELPLISRCHSYDINCKYTYKCNKCGYSIGRHSKSLDTEKKVCGYCYGKFELLVNYASKNPSQTSHGAKKALNSIPKAAPSTPRTPSAFALFVKENYGPMRRTQTASKHGD
ncbi:UNVERIFIED_CONTAM: hypothetical protein GTU68_028040, partial [Idotea baltica]|nr:hypothetical protein [Idotea baltica]